MRRIAAGVVAGLALLALADQARAATVAREGDALVVRTVGGAADDVAVTFVETDTKARFFGTITPGEGCAPEQGAPLPDGGTTADYPAACETAGVTRVRMLLGDADDRVDVTGSRLPVLVDFGSGNDQLSATDGGVIVATLGDGRDRVREFSARTAAIAGGAGHDTIAAGKPGDNTRTLGRSAYDGGDGDDVITITDVPARISGGPGNDVLTSIGPTVDDVLCGTGSDRVRPGFYDRVGDGCPPHVGGLRERGSDLADYSRRRGRFLLRSGRASGPARVTIRLQRLTANGEAAETVATGTLRVREAGRLTGSLRPAGGVTRRLRRGRRLEVRAEVTVRGLAGGADRETHVFRAYVRG